MVQERAGEQGIEHDILIRALYSADLQELADVLHSKAGIESIVEYDINEEGIQVEVEWGSKGISEYQKRIKIDLEKEHNKPLIEVLENKSPSFIERGSRYLKRKDQGSVFLIPKVVDDQVKRIYKVESAQSSDLFNSDNAGFFADLILAVVRRKEEIRQREALIEIVQNITAKMSLSERLNEIVKIVDKLSFINKVAIKLLEDGHLVAKAVSENFAQYMKDATSIEIQKEKEQSSMAISARAFLSRKTEFEPRLDKEKSKAAALGLTSMLSVPLLDEHGEPIGVMNVFTEREHRFSGQEISIIEKFSKLAALTIMNARMYEEKVRINQQVMQTLAEKEQLLDDLRNTQRKLLETEKLAVLGEIAVSVNHEINNPLTAIMLSAQVLKNSSNREVHELRKEIQERTTTIIDYIYRIQKTLNLLNNAAKSDSIICKEYVPGTNMLDLERMNQINIIDPLSGL